MEQLVNFIIRPPRADYNPKNDLLDEEFPIKGRIYQRKDLELNNGRGHKLQCSHYMPIKNPDGKLLPCVIYCHGNSGCRADASEAAIILLPSNITVFTLDFSGSGLSEGEHVTLGWNEKEDLRAVVNYLRAEGNVSCIGLWGRSMGAVTSLMYGADDPSIAGMVLDSPFSNLVDLMMELVDTYKYPLPKFTVKLAIQHMRKVIKKKANFDILELDTIQVAKCCFVPVLLGHAMDDDFIQPHHSEKIYNSYAGDKNIIRFEGDHNSPRPHFYFDSITIFFHNVLNPPKDALDESAPHAMDEYFETHAWDAVHGIGFRSQNISDQLAAISTEDAIAQLRSRRPMSRTEVPPEISPQMTQCGPEEVQDECGVQPSSSGCGAHHSNGFQHGQLIPTTSEDDYVEYSLDSFSDIPCSMEEEERMIMEAIMQSLKDMEVRHSAEEDMLPNAGTPILHQSASDLTAECNGPSEKQVGATPISNCRDSTMNETLNASTSCTSVTASTKSSVSSDSASKTDRSSGDASSSTLEADRTSGTRATLVVQKSTASNIKDGLVHRWGSFFFRNNR